MQAHESKFPEKIEQIRQSQQQLLKLIETASVENHDGLEIDAQDIAQQAFPDGHWPDGLSPWPAMHIHFAGILLKRGRLIDALMHSIRGYMFVNRRTGDIWVWHLFTFLQIISSVLFSDIPWEDPAFPTKAQLFVTFFGCLHELSLAANKVFGNRAGYAQAVQNWYSNCIESAGTIDPGTHEFAERFYLAQSRLLLWAGVDEKRGITLTQ